MQMWKIDDGAHNSHLNCELLNRQTKEYIINVLLLFVFIFPIFSFVKKGRKFCKHKRDTKKKKIWKALTEIAVDITRKKIAILNQIAIRMR